MRFESFLERQQSPVPGPLDAAFHIIQLGFGGNEAMSPEKLIAASQEIELDGTVVQSVGIYTDIPPNMSNTIEESEHTIEVAVRRSFDFMKLPVIIGGNNLIVPAVIRGLEDQIDSFAMISAEEVMSCGDSTLVLTIDGDSLPETDFYEFTELLSVERVRAVVITGSRNVNYHDVVVKLILLLDAIAQ